MAVDVSVAGGTPAWQRGIASILEAAGHRVEAFPTLADWVPGIGGGAVVIRADSDATARAVTDHSKAFPHIPIIAVVEGSSATLFARWIRDGSTVVLDELRDVEKLPMTLAAALEGNGAIPLAVLRSMAQAIPSAEEMVEQLSDEEIAWLRAMANGLTVMEIAEAEGYSQRAMFRLLRKLYMRLGVPNRTGALMWASRAGLLPEHA